MEAEKIQLGETELALIKNILRKYRERIAGLRVYVFGSRATWTAQESSDLDLALDYSSEKLDGKIATELKNEFEEAPIKIKIDIVDYKNCTGIFKARVDEVKIRMHLSEWREYKLGDVMDIIGGGTPKTTVTEYWGGNIPWLSVVDFGNGNKFVEHTEKKITELGLVNSSTKILTTGQIIISARGTVGELAVVKGDMAFNQSCYGLNAKETICNNNYLYYLLKYKITELKRNAYGAVFDTITRTTFDSISVSIPDLHTQKTIAEILSSLDDKIELNSKINAELELLAQKLFKQWFVDFEYLNGEGMPYRSAGGKMVDSELGEIPEGWCVKKLSEIIKVTGGGTPKRNEESYWNGDIPWFSVQDAPNNSEVVVIDTKEKITSEGLNNSSTKILPIGTTIITARGTVGKLAYIATPMAMNQSCYGINGIAPIGSIFNYLNLLKSVDELKKNTHGAVFDTITTSTFDSILSILPDVSLLKKFEEILGPVFLQFVNNTKENIYLKNLRDKLLPKLISGEIEV